MQSIDQQVFVLQSWHQSMHGDDSPVGYHVVIWSSVATTQSFFLHFYYPQLYSGEYQILPFYSFIHEIIHIECRDYFIIINRRVLMGYL